MRSAIAAIWCVLALAAVDLSVAQKERLLAEGKIVYLELLPVDPRSLMQGDYMVLRFKVAAEAQRVLPGPAGSSLERAAQTGDGRIVVALDERSVGRFQRIDDGQPLAANEVRLRYRVRNGTLKFATNAFFFQEGHAQDYRGARFGQLRVAPDGELLLQALRDEQLKLLAAPADPQ